MGMLLTGIGICLTAFVYQQNYIYWYILYVGCLNMVSCNKI